MASDISKSLLDIAIRLGIPDKPAIRKAVEYIRILKSKNQVKLSDTAIIVLCLDLAALVFNLNFDKDSALKLSGLKKSTYQNSLNNVKKVLDIDKPLTIAELCVQCNCTQAKQMAENILQKYKESDYILGDSSHPQYIAAAVYTACKMQDLKPSNAQFLLYSRLKQTQWKELTEKLFKFAEAKLSNFKLKQKSEKNIELHENNEITNTTKQKYENETIIEDYEDWKNRILNEAYAALGKEENK